MVVTALDRFAQKCVRDSLRRMPREMPGSVTPGGNAVKEQESGSTPAP